MAPFLLSLSRMDKQRWRISLREILWLTLWVAVLLAVWRLTDPAATKVCIHHRNSDAAIREQLLSHTPKGTPAVDVLEFILTKVDHEGYVHAYSEYVKALESRTGKRSKAIPTAGSNPRNLNSIQATVSERPVAFVASELVDAEWHFDGHDQLEDIKVDRYTIGP